MIAVLIKHVALNDSVVPCPFPAGSAKRSRGHSPFERTIRTVIAVGIESRPVGTARACSSGGTSEAYVSVSVDDDAIEVHAGAGRHVHESARRHQVVSSAKYSTRGAFVIPTSWRIGVGAKSTNCDRLGNREFAVYAIDPRWQIKRPACGRTVDAGLHGHCGGKNATDVRHDARANRDPLRDGLYVNAVRGAFCCEPRFAFIHQSPPEVISARERRRTKHDRDRDVAGIRHIRGQRYARQSKWIVVARGTEPKFDA